MTIQQNFWKERMGLPAYRVGDAARFAGTSVQTINSWQRLRAGGVALPPRSAGRQLSYLELIEVGVVAAMRKSGVPLQSIRSARNYLGNAFHSKHPFAEYKFMSDGRELILNSEDLDTSVTDKLIVVSNAGQYAWKEILQNLLRDFDYAPEQTEAVVRWHVAGRDRPIIIDPRVSFGAPQVDGIPTFALKERWDSGESLRDIADDYRLKSETVEAALRFERVDIDFGRPNQWIN